MESEWKVSVVRVKVRRVGRGKVVVERGGGSLVERKKS